MEIVLLVAIALVPLVVATDPAPGAGHSRSWSRNLDCERLGAVAGSERYPGRIVASRSRGEDDADREVVVCRERLTAPGLRSPADEAALTTLEAATADLASAAVSTRSDLADHTWLVEAFYPSPPVATKIAFATKNALDHRGVNVSDRTPMLSPDDLAVLTRMSPDQAYPAACARWAATGGLGQDDVLLGVVQRDPRETVLHAGVCAAGVWTWLR
ncbi:MAG: hypothetical protein ABMA64_07140 [Myxococcota bacterium]